MVITEPTITSDVNACICQSIAGRCLYENGWIYALYTNLEIRKSTGLLEFSEYNYLCRDGINVKKYSKYPWSETLRGYSLYEYIAENLERGYYVAEYLEEFEYNGIPCKPVVLYYDYIPKQKAVRLLYWSREDDLISDCVGFGEWFSLVLLPDARKRGSFLLDMLHPIDQKCVLDEGRLIRGFEKETLAPIQTHIWMRRADSDGKRHAASVLRDWHLWMSKCIHFYEKNGFTGGGCAGLDRECKEFAGMLSEGYDDKRLKRAEKGGQQLL